MGNCEFKVIIATHASLCEGYLDACHLILDTEFEGVETLPFKANMDTEAYEEKLHVLIEQSSARPLLIMTDLLGGTPTNIAAKFSNDQNIEIVTGINLSFVLEVLMLQENGTKLAELNLDQIINNAQKNLISVTKIVRGENSHD